MPITQVNTDQLLDNTIRDKDVATDAGIAMSKISGLTTALANKLNVGSLPVLSVASASSLALDATVAEIFNIVISTSQTFSISNPVVGRFSYFRVRNSAGSSIIITLPAGDLRASTTVSINPGATREFCFLYDGTYKSWQISEELV